MSRSLEAFNEVWAVDFEFHAPPGERPLPICLVARELKSGRIIRCSEVDLSELSRPPFSVAGDSLFVAYYASAELSCFLALGWPMPARILDLYVEFRCLTSGLWVPNGHGLLGALSYYNLPSIETAEKQSMQQLAVRGGPYTDAERTALLDYCETDVAALAGLVPVMLPTIDLPRALLRGRYMAAVARMEWAGTPIDTGSLESIRANWNPLQARLIERVGNEFQLKDGRTVYEGRTFKTDRFAQWLSENSFAWPHLPSGALSLTDETFRDMAKTYPRVAPLRQLRRTLSELRLASLAVGVDGRNRCLLSPFGSRTGRNQPSNSRFIFGPSAWFRSLIKPEPGRALAYIDYEQQEFAIAAALSNDEAMMAAYSTGDPYLEFAKQAGDVPRDATKDTHAAQREQFKVCALAVQYGMQEQSLAIKLNTNTARARQLLQLHRRTYPTFWRWSESAVDHAMLRGSLYTTFGWKVHVDQNANPRSLANFPMQANGAEMLRLATCVATEQQLTVCAPVHDALLIEAPIDMIDTAVAQCQAIMKEASELVLDGFPLRTDAKVIRYPDRYTDPRGTEMWTTVQEILAAIASEDREVAA